MTYFLTARERKLLRELQFDSECYQIRGQLPVGTGEITLSRLTDLGLLETGPGRFGDVGWRLTDDGWRCMYGKTKGEMASGGAPHLPLKVWSWPPTLDSTTGGAAPPKTRLASLPPRLQPLPPRLKGID